MLVERSELALPLRNEIERFLDTPIAPWRMELDQYIRRQIPFRLTYQDAAGRLLTFNIRFARIIFYEKRQYLECWCEETEGNRDLPELRHNWTLRLDRIPDAALSTVQGPWRSHLDVLEVEMHLLQSLAFAYEAKAADLSHEWVSAHDPPARRIVRQVSNTFWFFREVFRYGEDCLIVAPDVVKTRFKQKLLSLCRSYGLLDVEAE